jgi:hypothetical protein
MTLTDFRLICTALGFAAVAMQSGNKSLEGEGASRAVGMAKLIEEFCRTAIPEAFERTEIEEAFGFAAPESEGVITAAGDMAGAIVEIMKEQGGCLPQDLTAKGFSQEEIDRHWVMARALAAVKMNMSDA